MIKKESSKRIIFRVLFTLVSIAINHFGSVLAGLIAFPLYLDSVMTIAVTALCGFIPGLICAICSNGLLFFFANTGILFTSCHISTVLVAYYIFSRQKKKYPKEDLVPADCFMWTGFIAAITNSVLGDTISTFVYGANTSIPQVDNAVQGIYVVIRSLPVAAYMGGTLTNFVDKLISATISYFVYKLFKRLKHQNFHKF
ncbi:MAG: hypothetical protein J6J27_02725 [Alphaproteobacteria bacterium]|nr:hypothetical protein [Alphaproteobacteria bacterium]